MREIKFRIFAQHEETGYITSKEFSFADIINRKQLDWLKEMRRYYTIATVQYTGRKDKNGKEIYEGDISKDWFGAYVAVEWKDELGSCGCCFDGFQGCGFINVWEDMDVIGNIYEHPRLLGEKS